VAGCQRSVDGASTPAIGFESLPLTVQDVREISGFDGFALVADDDRIVPDTATPEGPCRALFDQGVAFGDDWVGIRTVEEEGDLEPGGPAPLIASAIQTVVTYANSDRARDEFDRRLENMTDCAALRLDFMDGVVSQPDPGTVAYVHDEWALVSAVKSSVVVDVSVTALLDAEPIASEMTQRILDRID
ncbi:MAG: sensor domain-containing protein, partial [Dietzia sp.]|nr:sensor domain-containing protein [Dietzia sp.]